MRHVFHQVTICDKMTKALLFSLSFRYITNIIMSESISYIKYLLILFCTNKIVVQLLLNSIILLINFKKKKNNNVNWFSLNLFALNVKKDFIWQNLAYLMAYVYLSRPLTIKSSKSSFFDFFLTFTPNSTLHQHQNHYLRPSTINCWIKAFLLIYVSLNFHSSHDLSFILSFVYSSTIHFKYVIFVYKLVL